MTKMFKKVSVRDIRKITFCKKTYFLPPSAQPAQERFIGQPVLAVQKKVSRTAILSGRWIGCKEG